MSQSQEHNVTSSQEDDAQLTWDKRSKPSKLEYLKAFETHFVNIVLIATFAAGVQSSTLAFMNDLLSKDSIQAQLFRQNPTELYRPRYTVYSLGLMFGLFAVAVNIGVGAVAAANATLACQFRVSVSTPETQPFTMEARALSCMLALFVSLILSGCSLILLSVEFDPTFTVFVGLVLLGGFAIVAYQPVKGYAKRWVKGFDGNELHLCSLVVSAVAFSVDLARPVEAAWYGGASFLLTVVYHIVEVSMLSRTKDAEKLTRRVPAFCATMLSLVWGGCVVVMLRWQFHLGRVDQVLSYVIASVAGIEAIVMGAIAARGWYAIVKNRRNSATSGGPPKQSDVENLPQPGELIQEKTLIAPSTGLDTPRSSPPHHEGCPAA